MILLAKSLYLRRYERLKFLRLNLSTVQYDTFNRQTDSLFRSGKKNVFFHKNFFSPNLSSVQKSKIYQKLDTLFRSGKQFIVLKKLKKLILGGENEKRILKIQKQLFRFFSEK